MDKNDITELKRLLREYIATYVDSNPDVTEQSQQMYAQVLNWIILENTES